MRTEPESFKTTLGDTGRIRIEKKKCILKHQKFENKFLPLWERSLDLFILVSSNNFPSPK